MVINLMHGLKKRIVGWILVLKGKLFPRTEPRYWKLCLPASVLCLGTKRLYFEFLRLCEWTLDVVSKRLFTWVGASQSEKVGALFCSVWSLRLTHAGIQGCSLENISWLRFSLSWSKGLWTKFLSPVFCNTLNECWASKLLVYKRADAQKEKMLTKRSKQD